jgi:hypothetical protein
MSDLFERIKGQTDPLTKIIGMIPGFKGYIERSTRRQSDKQLRGVVAERFEEQWRRVSSVQRDLISQGSIEYVDDMEAAAIKLRQFIDRVRTATYGYSGLFDSVKINEDELLSLYQYDLTMLEMVNEVSRAIDVIETSMGSDGLPAAIRNLATLAQQCVETFNKRSEVVLGGVEGTTPSQ